VHGRNAEDEQEDFLIAAKLASLSTRSQRGVLWHTSSLFRAGLLFTTLTGLLVHDLLGLHVLPPRGSASWTALVAACVALPFARALPTTPRRRHAWAAGHAAQGAFEPGSPPPRRVGRANRRGAAAEHAARATASAGARAAFAAWERETAVADSAADAAARSHSFSDDVDEVARVLAARDHFDVLTLRRDADGAAARRAYRTTALRVHPDKCSSEGAAAAWERVQRAGEVLTNDGARDEYAELLAQAETRGGSGAGRLPAGGARRRTAPAQWRGKGRSTAGAQY
jgi:DnaJ family protein B protein 12